MSSNVAIESVEECVAESTSSSSRKRNSNGEAISGAAETDEGTSRLKPGSKEAKVQEMKSEAKLEGGKEGKDAKAAKKAKSARWRTHQYCEDYVNFVGDMMYPKTKLGPYGFEPEKGRFPIEKINTLGYFTSPLRRPLVIEKWSPYEIALFESAILLQGKAFHAIKQYIPTKSVKEIIEFYYEWKSTSHYKQWKAAYKVDDRDLPVFDES